MIKLVEALRGGKQSLMMKGQFSDDDNRKHRLGQLNLDADEYDNWAHYVEFENINELHFKSDHNIAQIISGGKVVFEIEKDKNDYKINILGDIETWSRSKFKAYIAALKDLL